MNKRISIIIFIVVFACLAGIYVTYSYKDSNDIVDPTNNADVPSNITYDYFNKRIVVFDLDSFIDTLPYNTEKYDYLKVAFAVQGLINRKKPVLYYKYQKGGLNKTVDNFWLEELRKKNNYFNGYAVETYTSFYDVINLANKLGVINGTVLWDDNVPATSNVASTIAGVENLIPVRYDISKNSCYTDLVVNKKLLGSVKKNLVNKFANINYLPDGNLNSMNSGIASTKSAKNDAYLWAKKYYLDTKKTNTSLMAYSRDAWAPKCGDSVCVVGGTFPIYMKAGQEMEVTLTLLNNSYEEWSRDGNYRIAARTTSGKTNSFKITSGEFGFEQGDNVNEARLYLDKSNPISPGERVTIKFKIKAPSTNGDYYLNFGIVHDGVGWLSGGLIHKITVQSSFSSSSKYNVYPNYSGVFDLTAERALFSTGLNSSDYLIMNKAFFFDLSQDSANTPIDDKGQRKTGGLIEDYQTMNKLLEQQSRNNNGNLFTVVGFTPWFVKYTRRTDPTLNVGATAQELAASDVNAEWKLVEIVSSHGGEIDAEAFEPCGLTNSSFYTHVTLNNLKQNNDKNSIMSGTVVKEIYDSNTIYYSLFMGDYDAAAWTSGVLPSKFKYESSTKDKYPLAWAIDSDLSKRVPHVYNWLYANKKTNDYFVAGDNGSGYLNPAATSNLNNWKNHNIEMNNKFDIDITGFLITNGVTLPNSIQNAYVSMSKVLVGYHGSVSTRKVDNTPFIPIIDAGGSQTGQDIYNALSSTNEKFVIIRTVQMSRSDAYNAIDKVYSLASGSGKKIKLVDPYTLAYLYNNHPTKYKGCYSNGTSYKWINDTSIPNGYSYVSTINSESNCKNNTSTPTPTPKPASTPTPTSFLKGDVDGNGKIGPTDYVMLRKHILKQTTLTGDKYKRADANGDGNVNSMDYVTIRKIIISKLYSYIS